MIAKFLSLVRFSHTIFALPFALASMLIAANGHPSSMLIVQVLICMVTARNAAMAFNRLVDRKYDALNERTQRRHLVSGELSVVAVIGFIIFNSLAFVATSLWINSLTAILSVPTLLLLLSYSYWKRWSWGCHLFLGLSIGLSPIGAWVAASGEISAFSIWTGMMLLLWISGFDIVYATQDVEVDRNLGLHSIPVRFGVPGALKFALVLHLFMFALFVAGGLFFHLGWVWWLGTALVALFLLYIHLWRKSASLDSLNQDFFLANISISILVFLALVIPIYFH